MCSAAMSWGMGYAQFWRCSWTEYFAYWRKFQLEAERRDREFDYMAWWIGCYSGAALRSVYPLYNSLADPKKSPKYPYPKKPYLDQETKSPKQKEEDRQKLEQTTNLIQEHNLMIRAMLEKKQREAQTKPPLE